MKRARTWVAFRRHAAGYDLVTERGCEETFEEFNAVLGLETPKGKDGVAMDRKNLAFLRRLAGEEP